MCFAACYEYMDRTLEPSRPQGREPLSRRGLLKAAGALGAVAATGCAPGGGAAAGGATPETAAEATADGHSTARFPAFSRVVDLTHTLHPEFPTFDGEPAIQTEELANFAETTWNWSRWNVSEHVGTHLDAPIHKSADGLTADRIPAADLVAPLVVIDIRARAAEDADAALTPDDLRAWEAEHGPIPPRACVAMMSGWDKKAVDGGFRNPGEDGRMHFPGFHPEAGDLLLERDTVGLAVDTLSLDVGAAPEYVVHARWLPAGRWGIECIAHLDQVPASGATLVMGAPKVAGASGGITRMLALV